MAQLELIHVNKAYGKNLLTLIDLNLKIDAGEFIVIVGPSGCGKSTLLRMIAGLEEITSGELIIQGKRMNETPPAERGTAMVFQDYALYPHMNVVENITFGLKVKKLNKDEIKKRLDEAVQILGLESLLNRKPIELSGGQRQRVAIARALVKKPKVFLFDEPLSNLDVQLRSQTRLEIAELHRKIGSTTVYVTHDQTEAMTLADRIVLLNHGVIQQVGAPLELYTKPSNRFVASFIGSPAMNLIEGEIINSPQHPYFKFGSVEIPVETKNVHQLPNRKAITLGIRPESLEIGTDRKDFEVHVTHIERLGYETHIFAEYQGKNLTFRVSDPNLMNKLRHIKIGEVLPAYILKSEMIFFEAA